MIHIVPVNDFCEHESASTCKCCPSVDVVNGEMIFTHNSFDGREGLEIVNEILDSNKR